MRGQQTSKRTRHGGVADTRLGAGQHGCGPAGHRRLAAVGAAHQAAKLRALGGNEDQLRGCGKPGIPQPPPARANANALPTQSISTFSVFNGKMEGSRRIYSTPGS